MTHHAPPPTSPRAGTRLAAGSQRHGRQRDPALPHGLCHREILGLLIGTAAGLSTGLTLALAVALAFVFGFSLSTLPLLNAGLGLGPALGVVVAADTLSIATMELVDNLVMAAIPGAMDAGLVNPVFWLAMSLSLAVAYAVAFPVNRFLLARGKGHALTHAYHGASGDAGTRRWPVPGSAALAAAIGTFMLGGLVVSVADALETEEPAPSPHAVVGPNRTEPPPVLDDRRRFLIQRWGDLSLANPA